MPLSAQRVAIYARCRPSGQSRCVFDPRGAAGPLGAEQAADGLAMEPVSAVDVRSACLELFEAVATRRLVHLDDLLLAAAHVAAATPGSGSAWSFAGSGSGPVDGLAAVVLAAYACRPVGGSNRR